MKGFYYGPGTFAERSAAMVKSLTVSSVANEDQCLILQEMTCRDYDGINPRAKMPYRMTVAHISSAGWVDIFISEIDTHGEGNGDSSRHVGLTPHEFSQLAEAYAAHPATLARKQSGR